MDFFLTCHLGPSQERDKSKNKRKKQYPTDFVETKNVIKDAFGNVLEMQIYHDSVLVRHVKYCYDAHDNKVMETELSSQGIPIQFVEYHYRDNQLAERLIYDGNRNLKATKTYHYNTL